MFTQSRHVPGVSFAGLIHPGLIGCLPDPKLLETWNKREIGFIATNPNRVPPLANPPFAPTAHMGRLKGDAKARPRPTGARTVPPREHGGNCDIKDLSRGSKIYFPVYVTGAGLSMGDLHFSQGDGEITFCGAIEMAGWVHLKVDLIKGGMAKYGIKNPIFKPSADHAELQRLPDLRRHLGRRARQAALPRRQRRLSPGLPERDRIHEEVRLLGGAGLLDPRHRAGAGAYLGRGRHPELPARRSGCRPRSSTSTSTRARPDRQALKGAASTCRCRPTNKPARRGGREPPRSTGSTRIAGRTKMPVYEYLCPECGPFTQMRAMAEYELPSDCPSCEASSPRVLLTAPRCSAVSAQTRTAHAITSAAPMRHARSPHPAALTAPDAHAARADPRASSSAARAAPKASRPLARG